MNLQGDHERFLPHRLIPAMIPYESVKQSEHSLPLNFVSIQYYRTELEMMQELANSMFDQIQSSGSREDARETYLALQERVQRLERYFQASNLGDLERERGEEDMAVEGEPGRLKDPYGEASKAEIESVKLLKGTRD